jgi:hypothetical protein
LHGLVLMWEGAVMVFKAGSLGCEGGAARTAAQHMQMEGAALAAAAAPVAAVAGYW